jgi:pilus assembly protein CpaF
LEFQEFLQRSLSDPGISEIILNGAKSIWLEKHGQLEPQDDLQFDDEIIRVWVRALLSAQGKRIDYLQPYTDAALPCGSRLHVVGPPVVKHYCLSIRKQAQDSFSLLKLGELGALSNRQQEYLTNAIQARKNIFISGGTGSGKTTLLSALIDEMHSRERIIAVEDVAEIRVKHPHFLSLITRTNNQEGEGEITLQDLLRQTLRMRPDRVILGECRGGEALHLLLMLNTGHSGSMGTIHANSTREALHRLETLALLQAQNIGADTIRRLILGGIQVVVQLERTGSSRTVKSIAEIKGFEAGNYLLKEI